MRKSRITDEERALLATTPPRRSAPLPAPSLQPKKKRRRRRPPVTKPGYDGAFEIGARVVENPYSPGAKITVPANIRHDPLALMFNKKEIDEAQYLAGEKLRMCIERAGGAGSPAADWTRPFVDKSISFREPALTQLQAGRELKRAHAMLGWQNYRLVRGVVFDGLNGRLIAQAKGAIHERKAVKQAVREGLEQLAILWNYLSGPKFERKRADILAYLGEVPTWEHEEREVTIAYEAKT
ncbi:MAG: hypothetical protein ACOZAM_15140 [Pseudomonadota bacterium]